MKNSMMQNSTNSSPTNSKKLELLELIAEKERRMELNPLRYVTEHEKQKEASRSMHSIRLLLWGNRSLVRGTSVRMANGTAKNIEDVAVGDRIMAFEHETKRAVPSIVTATTGVYRENALRIEFGGGFVEAGEHHPFLVMSSKKNMRWVEAKDLRRKHHILIPSTIQAERTETLPVKTMKLLGYLIGDGSFVGDCIRFTNNNPEIVADFVSCVPNGYHVRDYAQGDYYISVPGGLKHGNGLITMLRAMGLWGKRAHEKHIPQEVFTQPVENIHAFLSGLFATDGWVEKNKIGYVTTSETLAGNLRDLLYSIGIHNSMCEKRDDDPNHKKQYEVSISCVGGYNAFPAIVGKPRDVRVSSRKGSVETRGVICKGVRNITALGEQDCFDITIAHPDHSFMANNVVVSNCGKSEWGAMETARYALREHPLRKIESRIEIWCVCPSYDTQKETTQKKLERYIPKAKIKDITFIKKNTWSEIELRNGNKISFKSYEQGREKFQGAGKRLIWFDEEPPEDIWEECFVRQEAGQPLDILLTMTPIKGVTWVYEKLYMNTANKDIFISEAGWDDNPFLTEEQKAIMARGLTPDALKVRREGRFVQRVGMVCDWWRRATHLKDYPERDRTWNWYEVLDGGYSDPAAWLLLGVDGDNNVHVVDGFREKGLLARDIKEKRDVKVSGLPITGGWTDTDDPRLIADLENLGMRLDPIERKVNETKGWDETLAEKLAEYGMIQKGTGTPRLFISNDLMRFDENRGEYINWLMQEIESLTWSEKKSGGGFETMPRWDDHRRYGHHFDGVRALAYFLISYMKKKPQDELIIEFTPRFDPYA